MLSHLLNLLTQPLKTVRGRVVVAVLIVTGIASIMLTALAPQAEWVFPAQVLLALAFLGSMALAYTPPDGQIRLLAAAAPAVGAVLLGAFLLPGYFTLLAGLGVGWFVAALFLFRRQTSPELMRAVRKMRRGEYREAISEMDTLIKNERDNPEHYRLRAMIFQRDGRPDRARRDYETMLRLAPEDYMGDSTRAEAYDGLAEVHMQAGDYEAARAAALNAHKLYPENWVPLYNLGLAHDRLGNPEQVVDYLTRAFHVKITDPRQRLLAHLYLARAYNRQGDTDAAAAEVSKMANMWKPLEDYEKLLSDEAAAPLRPIIGADVQAARALMVDELAPTDL